MSLVHNSRNRRCPVATTSVAKVTPRFLYEALLSLETCRLPWRRTDIYYHRTINNKNPLPELQDLARVFGRQSIQDGSLLQDTSPDKLQVATSSALLESRCCAYYDSSYILRSVSPSTGRYGGYDDRGPSCCPAIPQHSYHG